MEAPDPKACGWMGVVKGGMPGVGCERRRVVPVKRDQRARQSLAAGHPDGISIGLELVTPGQDRSQGAEQGAKDRPDQHEEQERETWNQSFARHQTKPLKKPATR